MAKWALSMQTNESGSVHTLMTNAHREQIEKNRKYVGGLINILLFLARQGPAFRGQDESKLSQNQGRY